MGAALTIAAIIASTVATIATKPKLKIPKLTKPEAPADLSGDAERTARRMAEQRRRQAGEGGRASTIMSGSPLGQPGQANTSNKYLTGA